MDSNKINIQQPCWAWCALLGIASVPGGGHLCMLGKAHTGPHKLTITTVSPSFTFTIEWKENDGEM